MKITFIIGLFFCSTLAFAQVKGLTEDGKEVVLFDNGTWRFVNESDAKSLETIITNNIPFQKSSDASFLMRSKRMNMGVYFNPNKWKVSPYAASPYTEYLFSKTNGDDQLVAFLITEKIQIPTLKNLKDIIIINIQKNADFFRLKESEYRTVNGLKVLYLRYIANTKGIDFEYVANYHINEEGYAGIIAFSNQKNFDKNLAQMMELLNGISSAKKQKVTETVEYSAPPPPMNYKK